MEQMAGAYVGPHEIVVKRNKTNLGIGAHINSVLDVCRGEIIVASAADDWSVPDRVHRLFDWWTTNAPCAALVYSNLLEVDCSGNPLNTLDFRKLNPRGPSNTRGVVAWTLADHIDDRSLPLTGASFAYRRAVFDSCGPLWPGVIFEDNVFNVRAEVMGGVALCPEALVYHRRHDEQVTNIYGSGDIGKNLNRRRQVKWNEGQTLRENRADMGIFFSQGLIAPDLYRRAQSWWDKRIKKAEVEYDLEFGVWPGRVLSLLKYRYLSRPITSNRRLLFRSLAPDWVYTFALRALAVARTL